MCAGIAIHNPVLTDDLHRPIDKDGNPTNGPAGYQYINPHAHILLTVRPINKRRKREAKVQKEYLCKRGEEQRDFTALLLRNSKLLRRRNGKNSISTGWKTEKSGSPPPSLLPVAWRTRTE